ncbi:MAG TPA: hypothetical protein VHB48_12720 [Chitinophagaceae bacterium]|jgi:hypothetical protein|nr:hypothetical protein [Chitinophagaceae bacterium]
MNNEEIEKFLTRQNITDEMPVKIFFKQRAPLSGIFVKGRDFEELKEKNFWRIVTDTKHAEWLRLKSIDIARIFNGTEFSKLENKSRAAIKQQ